MILSNLPTLTFFYILLSYFIGGITQGILGVGLITVVISLLSFVVDVKETIALVIIPTIITSFFQMINGNNLRKISIDTKFFLMIRRPPRSTQGVSSAASDVYKRQRDG